MAARKLCTLPGSRLHKLRQFATRCGATSRGMDQSNARIVAMLEAGRTVHLHQYGRVTKLTKKHLGMVSARQDGIYVLHGQWLCNPTGTPVTVV